MKLASRCNRCNIFLRKIGEGRGIRVNEPNYTIFWEIVEYNNGVCIRNRGAANLEAIPIKWPACSKLLSYFPCDQEQC